MSTLRQIETFRRYCGPKLESTETHPADVPEPKRKQGDEEDIVLDLDGW